MVNSLDNTSVSYSIRTDAIVGNYMGVIWRLYGKKSGWYEGAILVLYCCQPKKQYGRNKSIFHVFLCTHKVVPKCILYKLIYK